VYDAEIMRANPRFLPRQRRWWSAFRLAAGLPVLGLLSCVDGGWEPPAFLAPDLAPPGGTGGDLASRPPGDCRMPPPLPDGALFTDITDEAGLTGVTGVRVVAADINGDGWPDLIVHGGAGTGRDSGPTSIKRVLLNKGGRFVDFTAQSGLLDSRDGPLTGRLEHLAVLGDVDNDGDLDLFSGVYQDGTSVGGAATDRNEILLNDGDGHFKFTALGPVQDQKLPTSAASFLDYDRDGRLDLFVTTWYSPDPDSEEGAGNYLYRGQGNGQFADVSAPSGVLRPATGSDLGKYLLGQNRRPAYGASACDVDGDGNMDLLVSAYGRSWNELWRNQGNGTFREVGFNTPFASDDNISYATDNQFYLCYCKKNPGQCPGTTPEPKITCATYSWTPGFDDQPARNGGNTFSTACGDIDNDGDLDFMHAEIRHWHIGQSSDPSQLIRNDSSAGALKFTRLANATTGLGRTMTTPSWNEGDMEVAFFDFDNDGKKDIYLASSDYPDTWGTLFHQLAGGTFQALPPAAGVSHYHAHGFAAVDIDRDGDLDLIISTSTFRCGGDPKCPKTQEVRVYRNDVGHKSNFVQLRLRGRGDGKANSAAIGARVTVRTGGIKQVQEVAGGYGHFGMQHDTLLTFGLGAACAIDELEVRWPDKTNTVEKLTNLAVNRRFEILQGSGVATPIPIGPPK
jgi:hypothetical protein